jgi:phosphate-selective porin OprO and OprP
MARPAVPSVRPAARPFGPMRSGIGTAGIVWLMVVFFGVEVRAQSPTQRLQWVDIQHASALIDAEEEPPSTAPANDDAKAAPKGAKEPTREELLARIEALEKAEEERGKAAKKKKQAEEEEKRAKEAAAKDWQDVSSEKWTVKLGGHVQADYVQWARADDAISPASGPGAQNYFEFRRLRLVADGEGYGVYDFRLQMTLEPESVGESPAGSVTSPEVKDAYFTMKEIPWLGRMRIGNFFVPFSLEQVTNDTNNIFLERSIPTQGIFAADREVGIAFYNATENERLTWTTGVFLDSISESTKERIDDNQGYRISGRLTGLPYYHAQSNGRFLVHTGAGILHTGDQDGRVRFRARPQTREGPRLIDSGAIDAEQFTTANLEFAIIWGNVALQTESFLSAVDRNDQAQAIVNGTYFHVSYFLTGENRIFDPFGQHGAQFGRNVPSENFFLTPTGVGLGAWELKARWSRLDLGQLNAGQYNDFTFGANWYWTERTRVMFDWIHPITSSETLFGATDSDLLAMRFDWNW